VSWLGTPLASRKKRRNSAFYERSNSAMSIQFSAPLDHRQKRQHQILYNSCRCALPLRVHEIRDHARKPSRQRQSIIIEYTPLGIGDAVDGRADLGYSNYSSWSQ
jgi:hypothetical protein